MGDLVLGLAKTAVEGTLLKAKSAMDEETKLKQSVQRDLVFITGEFQMMQCFLNTTDAEDGKNAVFKAWVRQLRDLAFDVEDCIEFVVHLDDKSAWWWRMVSLPSCMAPPLPLDVAVGDIKELKARVGEVSLRSTRYNLISDSGSKPVVEQHHPSIAGATEFDMLAEVRDAAKKQHGLWNLTKLISREGRGLQVISLWGTSSDLGMKSIIREAYKDLHICEAFPCRAWVKLVHPFNPHEFIHSLLAQFYAHSCQEQGSVIVVDVLKRMKAAAATDEDLMGEFMQQMSKQRYLVVLEDLSTMVDWDAARTCLPDMNNGSRIVVSTQQFEIASLCTGHPNRISEIRQFSADHSVCVLFEQGFQRDGDKWEDDLRRGVAPQPQGNFHGFKSEAAHILGILKLVDSEIRGGKKSLAFKVMSVWGIDGVGKSALVRNIYHGQMLSKYSHRWGKYAWVSIPRPFSLTQFYRSLLWELRSMTSEDEHEEYSDADDYYRHEIGVRCCNILREHRCLFIIDGLESVGQWVEIDETLKLRNAKGCTIVITNEERLARHCADDRSLVCNVKFSEQFLGDKSSCPSLTISPQSQGNFNLVCRRSEEAHILANFKRIDTEIRYAEEAIFNVISVWGIAGVGKSAIVKSIYYDQMKVDYSHRWSKYGWVDVPHPFNLREFSRSLLLNILSSKYTDERANEHYHMSSTEDPIGECRDILREHRSLIVIDDLQSIEDWASISTALGIPSAKILIIVITNDESIAMHCAKYDYLVHNVRSLDPDAALHLFKYQARALGSCLNHPDIVKQVKLVLNKCGGLPKVIISMYRFVVFFGIMGLMEALQHLNANFMLELKKRADSDGMQGLLVWVHKYFRSCPDFLKPCVFYLPIFPPNYNIRRRRLLRRWIAEGYCRNSINATAEKNGEASFEKLVGLSMIQAPPQAINVENMSMTWCQVNGFFREYIISQPMEDNMVFALEERCSQSSHYTGRHLVIQSSWDRDDKYVFQSIDFSRLRSLTVFGGWNPFFVSDKMKVLRVLDLENTSDISDDHVEQIVELLPRLKFLSLRGCTSVSRLPTSLGNLKQLETLDVRHTSITIMPPTVINLKKLQYIRAGTTVQTQPRSNRSWLPKFCRKVIGAHLGVAAPKGIGKLEALGTLGVVNVGVSGGNAILKELKSLTQVRKLGVSGINRGNAKDLYSVIQALGHLESLSVRLDKDEQDFFCGVVDGISGPLKKNLKSLKLYGLLDMLPAWIMKLVNVCKLDLEMTMLSQEMIGYLSKMRRAAHICLCVKPVQDVEHNFSFRPHGPEGFPNLKVLEFDCSSRFVLTFERCISSIKLLKVHCNSGAQISGLAYLKSLERIWLVGSYEDPLKLDMERQIAEHPNKNNLVLQLKEVSSDVERDNEEVSSDVERHDGVINLEGYFSDSDIRAREGIPDLEDSDAEKDNEEVSSDVQRDNA